MAKHLNLDPSPALDDGAENAGDGEGLPSLSMLRITRSPV